MVHFAEGSTLPNFIKNLGWLGLSEMLVRVSRLLTVILLARFLSPSDYGIAALAMACYELVRTLNLNGIGTRILNADDGKLNEACRSVSAFNWIGNTVLFCVLIALAEPLASVFNEPLLAPMLYFLSTTFIIYPLSLAHVYLMQRNNRMKAFALIQGLTLSADNLATAALAASGYGAWSVVMTKPFTAFVWVICFRCLQDRDDKHVPINWQEVKSTFLFGILVFPTEMFRMLRLQGDVYIIGKVLGLEALGVYSFAKNAGIGISLSFINAYQHALLPNLCGAQDNLQELRKRYHLGIKSIGLIVVFVLLQCILAPIYVPILFGEKWISAIPVLQILCFIAIAFALLGANSQLLKASNKPEVDLRWSIILTIFVMGALFVFSYQGVIALSIALVVTYALCTPLVVLKGYKAVFGDIYFWPIRRLKNDAV